MTRLVPTLPPDRLMFEAFGRCAPAGYAVTNVEVALWSIAVTLTTTACAPMGTCPAAVLVICAVTAPLVPSVLLLPTPVLHWLCETPPPGGRVSQMRYGVRGVYAPGATNVYLSVAPLSLTPSPVCTVTSI